MVVCFCKHSVWEATFQKAVSLCVWCACRGLDNRTYYMLAPGGEYYNYSGCGNTLNCNEPAVRKFILDCLRYWVTEYHVDGFRCAMRARCLRLW